MITLNKQPGQRVLELGGGDNRNPASDVNCDVRKVDGVDFACDFEQPLPIASDEFDCVFSHFALEHVSYPKVPPLLAEIFRVLKPGGKAVVAVPNTEAQMRWIQEHPEGWDGKDLFAAASELLFGSQTYEANAHKSFWSPTAATDLFRAAGFEGVVVRPYGARDTDMAVEANKPANAPPAPEPVREKEAIGDVLPDVVVNAPPQKVAPQTLTREDMFDHAYFAGGHKIGGYTREGYRDFPVHEITFGHVMKRKPESVLEIGPARGPIVKRLQDAGIRANGLEISKHCWMTRWADGIICRDICDTPWPFKDQEFDLCFSIAVLEHVPEEFLPAVLGEMKRVSRRGLHGIDFGHNDDGNDLSHCTLRPKEWWVERFSAHGVHHEVVDKEELERGAFPEHVLKGDGKKKLNCGSHMLQFHHGWVNIDAIDLTQFAQANGYQFLRHDLRNGVPFKTGEVDLIFTSHFLEHLTYREGLSFLRDCRRALKPDGFLRVVVPDAGLLAARYAGSLAGTNLLSEFDEVNDGCKNSPTAAAKFWELLHSGHQCCYDSETLCRALDDAGFHPQPAAFRRSVCRQMLAECLDTLPCLSLFYEGIPKVG